MSPFKWLRTELEKTNVQRRDDLDVRLPPSPSGKNEPTEHDLDSIEEKELGHKQNRQRQVPKRKPEGAHRLSHQLQGGNR